MTGRLTYHVLEGKITAPRWPEDPPEGCSGMAPTPVTRAMTMLPKKLQSVG